MPSTDRSGAGQKARWMPLKVWDLPTRLFHWILAALVLGAWITIEFGMIEWHSWIGQAILVLLVYRLIWGIVGSETAQFWQFVRGPKAVLNYARGLLTGSGGRTTGHNPLGACMVVLMLLLLAAQAVLGLMSNDDIFFEGPLFNFAGKELSDRLTSIHHLLFNVVVAAVVIHVAAALFYLLVKKENLIGAMITGTKWWQEPLPSIRMTPAWLALPVLAIAAGIVWAVLTYL